jgi:energy-coupling factor transport system permease protein
MRADFQLYVRGGSWIHRLDPRIKLAFVGVATLFTFLWPRIWMQAAVIGICLALMASAHIPGRRVARVVRNIGIVALLVFILSVLFGGSDSPMLLTLGPFAIRTGGIHQGALLALRLLALALVFAVWLFTTDQADMVRGFVALGMPYDWGLTLALAFRYLPSFAGLYDRIRQAQAARGLDLEGRGLRERLSAYQPVLIALVISALRSSETLGWALEARGLGAPGTRRSVFRPLHMVRSDWLALFGLALILTAGIVLRIL